MEIPGKGVSLCEGCGKRKRLGYACKIPCAAYMAWWQSNNREIIKEVREKDIESLKQRVKERPSALQHGRSQETMKNE